VSARLSDEQLAALGYAQVLAEAGVPIFAAKPDMNAEEWNARGGHGATGYWLPKDWQRTTPGAEGIEKWRNGYALAAVMGVVVDGLDVDPRHGGKRSAKALRKAGLWPVSLGRQETPSGGYHDLIATLGRASLDGLDVGVDFKGGTAEGSGRGFLFIAPTVKLSKATDELGVYRWLTPPTLAGLTL